MEYCYFLKYVNPNAKTNIQCKSFLLLALDISIVLGVV